MPHSCFWLAWQMLTRPLSPRYDDNFDGAVAVIAVPFNCYRHENADEPDVTNHMIAQGAAYHMAEAHLPFYGQWEQGNLLWQAGYSDVHLMETSRGERVQSQRLVSWQAERILARGKGNKVVVVGMPDHLGRVTLLAEYYGLNPVVSSFCRDIQYDPRTDRPGAQHWCTSRERFLRFERFKARPGSAMMALLGMFPSNDFVAD